MYRTCGLAIVLALSATTTANALSIVVGNHVFQPNTPNQVIPIYVQAAGGEEVSSLQLYAQLGDGGPGVGGSDITPVIGIDALAAGTLFAANGLVGSETTFPPGYADVSVITNFGTITLAPGNNLLVNLTLDSVGFPDGSYIWPLLLTGTVGGNTSFDLTPIDITNGSIAVVPEPTSFVTCVCALVALGAIFGLKRSEKK